MNLRNNISLSEPEFLKITKDGKKIIPVFTEILGDLDSPVSIFFKLGCHKKKYSFLLESVIGRENVGRYSFLGKSFYKIIKVKDNNIRTGQPDGDDVRWEKEGHSSNPLDYLTEQFKFPSCYEDSRLPRFFGGGVGYVGYDSIRYTENIPSTAVDDLLVDDICFLFTDEMVIFDHVDRVIRLMTIVRLDSCLNQNNYSDIYQDACERLKKLWNECHAPLPDETHFKRCPGKLIIKENLSDDEFEDIVRRSIEYIKAGDIFQIVPSRRFSFPIDCPSFQIYRTLRIVNPSPYMYYLKIDDVEIIGSSPEILLKGIKNTVNVRPIAGTRPRGETPQEDQKMIDSLLNDEKEIAEHLMLIDLSRNDVGKVADYNSVKVDEIMIVEKYSHVMHIVSNVTGILRKDKTNIDALRSCMPAGTLSGAPKIRAMEIIDEFEPTRRGPYGGALGYFSFNGDTDTAIIIRTLLIKNGIGYLQAGAGIVYDSVPHKENQEIKNKIKGIIQAVRMARNYQ
jgi:anthranilate synthase component 1